MTLNPLLTKAATIVALIVLLLIPLSAIRGIVIERDQYRRAAIDDITASWTGAQLVTMPLLVLPYRANVIAPGTGQRAGTVTAVEREGRLVLPARSARLQAQVKTEYRHRGIYRVPVYKASIRVDGALAVEDLARLQEQIAGFRAWGTPRVVLGIGDARGISGEPSLTLDGRSQALRPGSTIAELGDGLHATLAPIASPGEIAFSIRLSLRGSQALQVAPVAEQVIVDLKADWPHPMFAGNFLPVRRTIAADGFEAAWEVNAFGTGANRFVEHCSRGDCSTLRGVTLGVSLIETIDLYALAERATKYGILFVLLTFVAFALTETLTDRVLHPLHYLLVGAALSIFYLLLISLAEHLGFAGAYGLATLACTALIFAYLRPVLASPRLAGAYAGAIALLYATLFVILQSEDYALLMGSLLMFLVLATVMLSTRRVDWSAYGRQRQEVAQADRPR